MSKQAKIYVYEPYAFHSDAPSLVHLAREMLFLNTVL